MSNLPEHLFEGSRLSSAIEAKFACRSSGRPAVASGSSSLACMLDGNCAFMCAFMRARNARADMKLESGPQFGC